MGFLRIHCGNCGGTWEVYATGNPAEKKNKICPHCLSNIDGQDWQKVIVPAFGTMEDANRTLLNTHTGYHAPLFTVDYIANHQGPDTVERLTRAVYAAEQRVKALRADIEALQDKLDESN